MNSILIRFISESTSVYLFQPVRVAVQRPMYMIIYFEILHAYISNGSFEPSARMCLILFGLSNPERDAATRIKGRIDGASVQNPNYVLLNHCSVMCYRRVTIPLLPPDLLIVDCSPWSSLPQLGHIGNTCEEPGCIDSKGVWVNYAFPAPACRLLSGEACTGGNRSFACQRTRTRPFGSQVEHALPFGGPAQHFAGDVDAGDRSDLRQADGTRVAETRQRLNDTEVPSS